MVAGSWRLGVALCVLAAGWLLVGCERPSSATPSAAALPTPVAAQQPTPTLAATSTPLPTPTAVSPTLAPTLPPTRTPTAVPAALPTSTYAGPVCGEQLPILPAAAVPITAVAPNSAALAALRQRVPEAALPALLQLLAEPGKVGLAAYRVGQAAQGVYLNQDVPMPLASVVKVVHLVAYAEAVAAGELNPLTTVPLADIEAYYQPGLDLGAHERAVAELTANGRTFGNPPNLLLDEVPWMMIRHSSNAATDYLHMLLGQTRIEETAVALGLYSQTAPCPFLGQFLAMGNYTRAEIDDQTAVRALIANPEEYGRLVMELTLAYSSSADFRAAQQEWRSSTRRPIGSTQRLFVANLNAHGTAQEYADLMARIALNGLSSGESSYLTRRYLEWPMRFAVNQALFTNLGYKNGSLPGILTTVYYAYPRDTLAPVVVALFFRDLDSSTYRAWRNNQAHDELARWLLYDPQAIPLLRDVLQ